MVTIAYNSLINRNHIEILADYTSTIHSKKHNLIIFFNNIKGEIT